MLDYLSESEQYQPIDKSGKPIDFKSQESSFGAFRDEFETARLAADPAPFIERKLYDYFDNSPVVPHDQLPDGVRGQVGVHTNITQNELNYIQRNREEEEIRSARLNEAPDNFFTKVGIAGSGFIGGILSPGNLGVTVATIGTGAAARPFLSFAREYIAASDVANYSIPRTILNSIGNASRATQAYRDTSIYRGIAQPLKFGVAQSTISGLTTPFEYLRKKALFEPTDYYDDMVDNIRNGFYGGVAFYFGGKILAHAYKGTVGAFKKYPISNAQASSDGINLAQEQVNVDKQINTDAIRDNSLFDVSKKISDSDVNLMQNQNEKIQSRINDINEELSKKKIPELPHKTTLGNLKKVVDAIKKDPFKRTKEDNSVREDILDSAYYKELVDAQTTMPHERTVEQSKLLENASNLDEEANYISKEIKSHENDIISIKNYLNKSLDSLSKMKLDDKNLDKLLSKIESLDKKIDEYNNNGKDYSEFLDQKRSLENKLTNHKVGKYAESNKSNIENLSGLKNKGHLPKKVIAAYRSLEGNKKLYDYYNDRLSEIESLKKLSDKVNESNDIHKLELERDGLQHLIDSNTAALNIKNNAVPVSNSDLRNQIDNYNRVDTDLSHSPILSDLYDNEIRDVNPIDEINQEYIDDEFEDLPQDIKDSIEDEYSDYDNISKSIPDIIKNLVSCLRDNK